MKSGYEKILVLAITAMLLTITLPCRAAEGDEDNIWSEDMPKLEHRRFELTEEKIEHIMGRLAEEDPEKAKELEQLKEEDFEKFKVELRETMREQFSKKFKERMRDRPRKHMEGNRPFGPGHVMPEMGRHWKYDKYLDWMKENYPGEAEKLAELREKDPNLYWKKFGLGLKKYGRIADAARKNPQLAEVLKKDLELKQQRDELLEEIKAADGEKKEELTKNLEKVIGQRFDLIVKRKQIEYEQLIEKLESLKKEVKEREAKVVKWQDAKFKNESIKARLEELLGGNDEFKW